MGDEYPELLESIGAKFFPIDSHGHNISMEMVALRPDIILLQDVDEFMVWWKPSLIEAGYDGIFAQCDNKRRDGFNEVTKSLKTPNEKMRAHTGDVGLCAMLQPNDDAARARIPTAVCVITAKFASGKHFHDIRELQAKYLVKQIDEFNQSFQLPIIVGLSASAAPDSNVMHILESGFVQNRPLLPSAPISEPVVSNASLSSVYIEWEEAPDEGDAPVVFYRIERRAGKNTSAGFLPCMSVPASKTSATVTGLSSSTWYQFRVTAVSALGAGEPSEASAAIFTQPVSGVFPAAFMDGVPMHSTTQHDKLVMKETMRVHPFGERIADEATLAEEKLSVVLKKTLRGIDPPVEGDADDADGEASSADDAGTALVATARSRASHRSKASGTALSARVGANDEADGDEEDALVVPVKAVDHMLGQGDTLPVTPRGDKFVDDGHIAPPRTVRPTAGFKTAPSAAQKIKEEDARNRALGGGRIIRDKPICAATCRLRHKGRIHVLPLRSAYSRYRDIVDESVLDAEYLQPVRWPDELDGGETETGENSDTATQAPAQGEGNAVGPDAGADSEAVVIAKSRAAPEWGIYGAQRGNAPAEFAADGQLAAVATAPEKAFHQLRRPRDPTVEAEIAPSLLRRQILSSVEWFNTQGSREPPYTSCNPIVFARCSDYILYTTDTLYASGLLAMPRLEDLGSEDTEQPTLPSRKRGSSHLPLLATFEFNLSTISSMW